MGFQYSTKKFWRDWRFQIDKDFIKPSGDPYDYAENGLQEWGQEQLKFPLKVGKAKPSAAAISHDGKLIAVSAGFDVQIYDLQCGQPLYTLVGHVSEVDGLAFRPGDSSTLVSSAMSSYGLAKPADPQIIIWDLTKHTPNTLAFADAIEHLARNASNSVVADIKTRSSSSNITARDQEDLAKSLEAPIRELIATRGAAEHTRIWGRITTSFQSEIFSPSGKLLFYMPGNAPRYNGDDDWVLKAYSVDRKEDAFAILGHRDAIMWIGCNHDESLVGTASWDKCFCIWDTQTGRNVRVWITEQQNWTGGFSPDGQYFAGTSGDGRLHVYDLHSGTEHWNLEAGVSWNRALSWHPSAPLIALGGEEYGRLQLVNVTLKTVSQTRLLSTAAMKLPEDERRALAGGFLWVNCVQFVDGGRKIAFFTTGDGSAEVYDLVLGQKWRYARSGTMNPPEDKSEVTSKGGEAAIIREDAANQRIILASVDRDHIRIWHVPMTES